MISRFFIDRPIFATVLSIIITLAGGVTVFSLSIAQYPPIAPPTVQVSCTYPGASAQVVGDTVAAPIEQQVNGVENMLYMQSQCTNDGSYNLTVTFAVGTDLKISLVQVQNRVQLAMPLLPEQVQKQGVNIKKKSPDILLVVNLVSPDGRYDDLYLSNYATIQIKDELLRLYGVGDITYLGQRDYSMRAWLDPEQLAARNLTAGDVAQALSEQNQQVVSGQVGQQPAPAGQDFQTPLTALGRLVTTPDFGDIIIKTGDGSNNNPDIPVVRLRDLGRLELASQQYSQICMLDGQSSVGLAIFQLPDTNALDTATGIRKKMDELAARFPAGLEYKIVYDTTPFIGQSIVEVLKSLRDAIILVAIVVLVFLQNWRATLIPLLAVPVAIVGTFAAMAVFGFSLNNLSLFGLVLAIGIVVDDAIVVVENVERWLAQGLSPHDAAVKAMEEVTGPVVAVALVLCAVFVPCAFITGIVGEFFRQFALTIAVSTVISAFNSLTFSPAMAALLLKPHGAKRDPLSWLLDVSLGWFFRLFNGAFNFSTSAYTRIVGLLLRGSIIVLVVYLGLLFLTYRSFIAAPPGFIPIQDKGYLIVDVQLPDAASVQRTKEVMDRIDKIARRAKGVKHTTGIAGQSLIYNANSTNWGSMFVILDDFDKRHGHDLSSGDIAKVLQGHFTKEIREAVVNVFPAPPVSGLGTAGGLKFYVEDRASLGSAILQDSTDDLVAKMRHAPGVVAASSVYRSNTPQLFLDIDRTKIRSLGVNIKDVFDTLQIYMGGMYVNNFNVFGRSWQVNIQADGPFRTQLEDVGQLKVRNQQGEMVPMATLMDVRDVGGPVMVVRYKLYAAAPVIAVPDAGGSAGARASIEQLAQSTLPPSMSYEWSEIMLLQILAGNTAMYLFALGVVLVFLVLAALYESWSLPFAVILVVPMCLLCSVVGIIMAHLSIDILAQIGFVVLVGLASKNAILIVEFAKQQREEGMARREATLESCRLRLRPIMMTSFAFILGVVPLVVAEGAGAEMRQSLGTAVFSGMLGVTLFGIFLTPVFFYVIDGVAQGSLFAWPAALPTKATMRRFGIIGLIGLFVLSLIMLRVHFGQSWRALGALVVLGLALVLVRGVVRRKKVQKALPVAGEASTAIRAEKE